jgi:sugar lactone lactonase YvrE
MTLVLLPGQSLEQGVGIVGSPIPQESGVAFSVTVAAVDTDYQVAYVATGTISLTTTDPDDAHPGSEPLVNGQASFLIDPRAIGQWTIEISGGPGPNLPSDYIVSKVIRGFAGTGSSGFAGDGGPAEIAKLTVPFASIARSDGSYYIADTGNGRIRRVSADGTITTVAGGGQGCPLQLNSVGDGCLATSAKLNAPSDMAFDTAGHMYIADQQNHRIRRVDASTGVISTYAGTGTAGFSGDGGPAALAQFALPTSIEFDAAGNLYVTDENNHRVRRITPDGTVSTFAGNGVAASTGDGGAAVNASLNLPTGLAIDAGGAVLVAEQGGHRVRRIEGGTIVTLIGTGVFGYNGDGILADEASLSSPFGLAVDAAQNVYVADTGSNRVRRVDLASGRISTIAGNGSPGSTGDGGLAVLATLDQPLGVMVDPSGSIVIADTFSHRIRRIGGGGLSPTPTPTATPTATATPIDDPDGDGVPTDVELLQGTDPNNPDTDGDGFMDYWDDSYAGVNTDTTKDNCPLVFNPDQINTDAAALSNGPNVPGDDITIVNGDALGDACDPDDDNDGILDVDEGVFPMALCPSASAATNPLLIDSDGDTLTDGWECLMGSDPMDPNSKALGTTSLDEDGDTILDLWELRGYGGNIASLDSDGDGCHDRLELASIDGDRFVTTTDRLAVARASLGLLPPDPDQDYVLDINKNGVVDAADRLFVARAQLVNPPPPCA